LFYGDGLIKTEQDFSLLQLPDPYDDALYAGAERFVEAKGDFACFFVTRIGIFSTMLSMGFETFSIALYENPSFIETVLDRYCNWAEVVAERICGMGFDAYISTDDMAFKSGPFFSPQIFHDLVIPRYKKVSKKITLPWIIHSDGDMTSFISELLTLGISGFHPNEKGAMDIRDMKYKYDGRLCLLGNVDLNILGNEKPADVQREVMELIRNVGPGGGYIVTSGNSLAGYLIPENVKALSAAVQKFGRYPLSLDVP
jgi:uroporphyrinogen decarboxylase